MSKKKRPPSSGSLKATRPHMPAGYGLDRSSVNGMISWPRVSEQLAKARNYWIITARPDGQVHAAPVWGLWLDGTFYFSTDPDSRKGRNLAANPNLVVHLESGDDVVILRGAVEQIINPSLLVRYVDSYEKKYRFRPDANDTSAGVYKVKLRVAYAWSEKNFPKSATRWFFP